MTFEDLCAQDGETLNLLIEQYCYPGHQWKKRPDASMGLLWELEAADVWGKLWSSVPHLHHTASWDKTMTLAFRYAIGLWPLLPGIDEWLIQHPASCQALPAYKEEDARLQICRLAVWQAMQAHQEAAV